MVQMSAILPNLLGFTITQGSFHLRLRKVLGQGAYGVVYLAEDISSSSRKDPSHYAVKCLLRHPAGSEYARQQAREIAYHLALSHHPNVVTLHCVIEEEFYTFLVMDYCPGGDLFNTIIERAHFVDNDAAVKNMFLQLLDAVQTAHDLNIYHRDLKPENILCSADDEHLYLSDFGLATKSKLSNGFGCGSSFYMSPECIGVFSTKKPYSTAQSDIWALGIILTNMITGRNPWHVASPRDDQGFRSFLHERAPYLQRMLPMSRGASEILARIFEPRPERRITINQLRAAIRALDTFFPSPASPAHPVFDAPEEESDIVDCARPPNPQGMSREFWDADTLTAEASTFVNAAPNPRADADEWAAASMPPISDSASSSDAESAGPVTPTTIAHDPATLVPDEFALEEECDITSAQPPARSSVSLQSKKLPKTVQRLVSAVQRIKIRA